MGIKKKVSWERNQLIAKPKEGGNDKTKWNNKRNGSKKEKG
jgi:hypothetical protein